MKVNPHQSNDIFRLIAGWCSLLLYVGAFSPVGMVVVALLGTIDPDHHALFQPAANGMCLVLHHEGTCAAHRHHVVARALTLLAQPDNATGPDHVVQFAAGDGFWRGTQQVLCRGNSCELPHFVWTESLTSFASRPAYFLPPPAPPGADGNLFIVRCTVLLI